jgi:N12 class adenine-specific DNA methylase
MDLKDGFKRWILKDGMENYNLLIMYNNGYFNCWL